LQSLCRRVTEDVETTLVWGMSAAKLQTTLASRIDGVMGHRLYGIKCAREQRMKTLAIVLTFGALLALALLPGPHGSVSDSHHGDQATDGHPQDRSPHPLESVPEARWGIPFSLLHLLHLVPVRRCRPSAGHVAAYRRAGHHPVRG
jgi:hypothetical protein